MAYVYKIWNDVNDKIYIGKTLKSIDKRFKEHCRDSKRERMNKRPLYNAMNKYGIDHFHIEEIEKCDEKDVDDREKYWIDFYNSFIYGYNATVGGDGRRYADYGLILSHWKNGKNNKEIQQTLGYSRDTITIALSNNDINDTERIKRGVENSYRKVAMLNKHNHSVIKIFSSIQQAYDFLGKDHSGHIASVCNGKRKSAYGYCWKYC